MFYEQSCKNSIKKIVVFLKLIGAKFKYKLRDNSNTTSCHQFRHSLRCRIVDHLN